MGERRSVQIKRSEENDEIKKKNDGKKINID